MWCIVLWDSTWHAVRPYNRVEQQLIRKNGGEIVCAGLRSRILADKICSRLDRALEHKLEGETL